MPEDNFEQQARQKADGFSMEPKPEVWQRVEAAIAPQKRKRRVLLWWWLLPLGIAGMVAAIWIGTGEETLQKVKPDTRLSANNTETSISKKQEEKESAQAQRRELSEATEEKLRVTKSDNKTDITGRQNKELDSHIKSKRADKEKVALLAYSAGEKNSRNFPQKTNDMMNEEKVEQQKTEEEKPVVNFKYEEGVTSKLVNRDSIYDEVSKQKDKQNVLDSVVFTKNDSTFEKAATQKFKKATINNRKWQIGVMSEIGLASWAKNLLENNSNKNSGSNYLGSLPNTNADAGMDSLLSGGTIFRQTKNGVNAAFGMAFKKSLSKHFYFSAQLGYRYQQYQVSQFLYIFIPQSTMNLGSYFVNSDIYHTHFLNLTASVGAGLLTGKRMAWLAEAGMDNSFLFLMKQQDKTSVASFSSRQTVTQDFYRWQPHVLVSLPLAWQNENRTRLQVAPFARFGLHSFEKNNHSYQNNQLTSAGVQLIYFFR